MKSTTIMVKVEKWKIISEYRYKQSPYMWSGSCEARTGPRAMDTWETIVLLTSSLDLSGKPLCAMLINRKIFKVKVTVFQRVKVESTCCKTHQLTQKLPMEAPIFLWCPPPIFIDRLISLFYEILYPPIVTNKDSIHKC